MIHLMLSGSMAALVAIRISGYGSGLARTSILGVSNTSLYFSPAARQDNINLLFRESERIWLYRLSVKARLLFH